jgi:hypothetical protein
MELPWLMSQIETHAEQLSERAIQALRTSPRIKSLGSTSEEELRRRFFDLYRNLGRWLGEKGEAEIEATYGEIGRRRCREGVPLNELIYALIIVKQELWGYIQKHIAPASEGNLYQEELIIEMMGKFFDRAMYHTIRGYEEVWTTEASLQLLSGKPSQADTATTGIARAILGELEARRGILDNDLRLRSVTFTVRLDPPGAVRSVTLQQETYSEGGRRS